MKTIKVLLINHHGAEFKEIENTLAAINEELAWKDSWNTPTIKIDQHDYILVCSDTGKLRHEPVSAISKKNFFSHAEELLEPFMVGNIMISKFDGIDDFESLNDDDIERLQNHLFNTMLINSQSFYPIVLILD